MDKAIEQFLENLPEEKRKPASKLRELILKTNLSITEAIKWGNITFIHGKANLAFIYTYKTVNYINLGFSKATSLADPDNLFEGTGAGMRHIKIETIKDIPTAQVKAWIKEAIALEEVKGKAKSKTLVKKSAAK